MKTSDEQAIAYSVALGVGFIVLGAGAITILALGSFIAVATVITPSTNNQ
jgi:hypothetical protein